MQDLLTQEDNCYDGGKLELGRTSRSALANVRITDLSTPTLLTRKLHQLSCSVVTTSRFQEVHEEAQITSMCNRQPGIEAADFFGQHSYCSHGITKKGSLWLHFVACKCTRVRWGQMGARWGPDAARCGVNYLPKLIHCCNNKHSSRGLLRALVCISERMASLVK